MTPLNNSAEQSNKRCWKDQPKLKTALTVIIPIILLVIIIFLGVFLRLEKGFCTTDPCIQLTNKLKRGMNLDINPCDNFYEFVCGDALKDTSRKNLFDEIKEKADHDLLKLYTEDIKDDEHKMVKIAKGLFQKCMDTEDIEKDGLTSIKGIINAVGGWPVLDNENDNFDWVQATYKLTELEYPPSFLINVYVTREIENKEEFYLKITMLDEQEEDKIMSYSQNEAIKVMENTAKLFGARDEDLVKREMSEAYEFRQKFGYDGYRAQKKYTIEQFQKEYDKQKGEPFKWLEFLNTMIGPKITVSSNDYISIQDPYKVSACINLLSTTSKRTVGNWLIWTVIQTQLPYLPKSVQNIMKYSTNDSREEFCLKETNNRFVPSPIEVINTRNSIASENRQEVQEIFSNIKSEYLNFLKKTKWIDEKDKRIMVERAKTLTLIYGLPGDYLNDKMLDDMDVDLVERRSNTFLGYLAQANRNLHAIILKQITLPASSNTVSRTYLNNKRAFPTYYTKAENEYFLATQYAYYLQNDMPKYFKYSFIGKLFGSFFVTSLSRYDPEFGLLKEEVSQQTNNLIENLKECLVNQTQKHYLYDDHIEFTFSLSDTIGEMVSYRAYEKWIQHNGEEKLPDSQYASRQLFWIAGTNCHVPSPRIDYPLFNDVNFYSNISLMSKLNNADFARNFKCPLGSETNPVFKCPLML